MMVCFVLFVYKWVGFVLFLLLMFYFVVCLVKGKEDVVCCCECFGYLGCECLVGLLVWFYVVSVGEMMVVILLICEV